MAQTITALEQRLSEALGEAVWKESGLGAPLDVDSLQRRITELEHANVELRKELRERDDELDAARTTNRELMTRLDTSRKN